MYIFFFKTHFRDRKGVLYSMYAIGAHGNAENLPNFKKASASQLTSPLHKRTRIMFDDILANAAKKGRKGQNITFSILKFIVTYFELNCNGIAYNLQILYIA